MKAVRKMKASKSSSSSTYTSLSAMVITAFFFLVPLGILAICQVCLYSDLIGNVNKDRVLLMDYFVSTDLACSTSSLKSWREIYMYALNIHVPMIFEKTVAVRSVNALRLNHTSPREMGVGMNSISLICVSLKIFFWATLGYLDNAVEV
ncbi:transmembrane protein [Spatholobus suberectus]|nr:transmembrane protein [Spatholobus suberectus]